jgi:hypothetical protein
LQSLHRFSSCVLHLSCEIECYLPIAGRFLFLFILLFICGYKAWVISPPCPHSLPYHPLRPHQQILTPIQSRLDFGEIDLPLFLGKEPSILIPGWTKGGPFWLICWHTLHLAVKSQARSSKFWIKYCFLKSSVNFVDHKWVVSWRSFMSLCPRDRGRNILPSGNVFYTEGLVFSWRVPPNCTSCSV